LFANLYYKQTFSVNETS